MVWARVRSRVTIQTMAPSTAPPSSGAPGSMFTAASRRLTKASHSKVSARRAVRPNPPPSEVATAQNAPASTKLVTGPMPLTRSSAPGVAGSVSNWV